MGWVCWIYLSSLILAVTDLSPLAAQHGFAVATFQVADEVAPFAKIGFGVIFGLLAVAHRLLASASVRPRLLPDVLAAIAATLLVLALLPADWSRGFGIGLTGARFTPVLLAIYMAVSVAAALALNFVEHRCRR